MMHETRKTLDALLTDSAPEESTIPFTARYWLGPKTISSTVMRLSTLDKWRADQRRYAANRKSRRRVRGLRQSWCRNQLGRQEAGTISEPCPSAGMMMPSVSIQRHSFGLSGSRLGLSRIPVPRALAGQHWRNPRARVSDVASAQYGRIETLKIDRLIVRS